MAFGPFSLLPRGLPNMFGLTGQAMPKAMEENVRLELDLFPFLSAANANEVISQVSNVNSTSTATFSNLIVPDGEAWIVHGFSVGADVLATEMLRGRPVQGRVTATGNSVFRVIGDECGSSLQDTAAQGQVRVGIQGPLVMYPGEFLGFGVTRIITAAQIALIGTASIYRFTV